MPLCVFCRNDHELTEEHIVPDCIGGSLKPKLLCKACNDTLGSTIDGPFANTLLIQLPRQLYQIPGKGGTVPNPFSNFGVTIQEERNLSIRLDEQFKPYVRQIVSEQRTDEGLEISITIDKEDEGDIENIIRKKNTRYYRSLGMPEDEIQTRVAQVLQIAKNVATPVSRQPMIKYSFSIDINALFLESIKIAYEIAALEFGDSYVNGSPVAETLRRALQYQRQDGIVGGHGIDFGPLKAKLPGQDAHYVLLLNNVCVVSVFGIASVIKYCGEQEDFVLSMDDAVIHVFDPVNKSHARNLLADFFFQRK